MSDVRWSLWAQVSGDEKSARVYDCLLAHGTMSPKQIAARLDCPRSTLYEAFGWLRAQDLVSTVSEGRSLAFMAAAPSRWRTLAEVRRAEADRLLADIDRHMGEWTAAYRQGPRPRAHVFEGEEGLRAIRAELVRLGGEVWEYFAVDERLSAQAKIDEKGRIRQTSVVHGGRVLLGLPDAAAVPPFFDRRSFEVRWTPLTDAPFSGSLTLARDRAYFVSPQEDHFGLVVESSETIELLRSLYEALWRQASPWTPPAGWGI